MRNCIKRRRTVENHCPSRISKQRYFWDVSGLVPSPRTGRPLPTATLPEPRAVSSLTEGSRGEEMTQLSTMACLLQRPPTKQTAIVQGSLPVFEIPGPTQILLGDKAPRGSALNAQIQEDVASDALNGSPEAVCEA